MRFMQLILLPVFIFGNYLIKVDVSVKSKVLEPYSEYISVIDYFEGDVIAESDATGLILLNDNGIAYLVLDEDPAEGFYFMAEKNLNVDIYDLNPAIQVLFSGTDNWLIKITNIDDVLTLNKHPIELKRINFDTPVQKHSSLPVRSLARDTLIQQMVDSVLYDSIISTVQRLQDFQTRYSSTDSAEAAANWLLNKFNAYGFDSVFLDTFSAIYAPNVVAIKYGMVYSPQNYVVGCGHFDCTSPTPTVFAPGADDNASALGYVMEIARVLSNYLFEYTIHFIGFCGEEQGLLGSADYAQQAYARNDTIIGVINMDMFAYSIPNRDTFMIVNDTSYIDNLPLALIFQACADSYTTVNNIVWTGWRPYSDHASFCQYGYHGIQGRENIHVSNPYYHTTGDTIGGGYNDDTLVFKGVQAALATVATLAIPWGQPAVEEHTQTEPASRLQLEIYPTIQTQGAIEIIGYMPVSGNATLSLYDAVGRTVVKCEKIINKPGYYSFTLDTELNTGVYFVEFKSGAMSLQKKFIVCK